MGLGSVQLAAIFTVKGAFPRAGEAEGEHCSGGSTLTVCWAEPVRPLLSMAVTTTVKVPLELKVWFSVNPWGTKIWVPSPQLSNTSVMLCSGEVHSPEAVTVRGAMPELG